jgi:hypothetical protein
LKAASLFASRTRVSMPVTIVKYTAAHMGRVADFNTRLLQAGYRDFQLPTDPNRLGSGFEGWLAVDNGPGQEVRGGYLLRHETFSFSGESLSVGFYNLSLSEGVINRAFNGVAVKMVSSALALHSRLFALGMGGLDRPLPRFLKAMGWDLILVPFFFYAVHPGSVLRNLRTLRHSRLRRLILDLSAFTGAATVGLSGLHGVLRLRGGSPGEVHVEPVPQFDAWADQVWDSARRFFAMIALRNAPALNDMYPVSLQRITRLKISRSGTIVGWAVVRNTSMRDHAQFGNLHVGTIVDCLAQPTHERSVASAAADFLKRLGADLIVTNQSHLAWTGALRSIGFLAGPSNYALAVSKALSGVVGPLKENLPGVHITRGDGDGPIHL